MTARKWTGLVVGIAGVLILSEIWGNDWTEKTVVVGTGLLLLAAVVNASTSVHIRRHDWAITPMQALPWQLAGAALILTIIGLIVDGPPSIDWTPQLAWIMVYESILASGVAFWAQIAVLRNLSAVSTNLTMTGVPVLGVVSSAVVLGEPITASLVFGMALVVAGVMINIVSDRSDPTQT
jgi:drug/metabolite transporter (DMT)-like permease